MTRLRWWLRCLLTGDCPWPPNEATYLAWLERQRQHDLTAADHAARRTEIAQRELHELRNWVDGDVFGGRRGDDDA